MFLFISFTPGFCSLTAYVLKVWQSPSPAWRNPVPELQQLNLGPLCKSSQPAELTESETEYTVVCIKHVFPGHVHQFDCTNILADQLLEKV